MPLPGGARFSQGRRSCCSLVAQIFLTAVGIGTFQCETAWNGSAVRDEIRNRRCELPCELHANLQKLLVPPRTLG
jgi:hypothetical protein